LGTIGEMTLEKKSHATAPLILYFFVIFLAHYHFCGVLILLSFHVLIFLCYDFCHHCMLSFLDINILCYNLMLSLLNAIFFVKIFSIFVTISSLSFIFAENIAKYSTMVQWAQKVWRVWSQNYVYWLNYISAPRYAREVWFFLFCRSWIGEQF
jgi:hypothetical protein